MEVKEFQQDWQKREPILLDIWRWLKNSTNDLLEKTKGDSGKVDLMRTVYQQVWGEMCELSIAGSSVCFAETILSDTPPVAHQINWSYLSKKRRIVILGPRDHGKTTVFSKWVPLEAIARNPNIRITLCSVRSDNAKKNLRVLKKELEVNKEFKKQFGYRTGPGEYWTEKHIYCRRTKNLKDPTVEAVGCCSPVVGSRSDLIICDDIIDTAMAESASQRKKVRDWVYDTLIELLDPDGRIIFVGTMKHFADVYNTLIEEDPTFEVHKDRAIDVDCIDDLKFRYLYRDQGGKRIAYDVEIENAKDIKVLWPEFWSLKQLLIKRVSMSALLFERENQNNIIDDETSPFKLIHLQNCRELRATYLGNGRDGMEPWEIIGNRFEYVVQSWDLARVSSKKKAEERDSDYQAGITVGIDGNGRRWLLNIIRERGLTFAQRKELLKMQYFLYRPILVIVESNLFQNDYVQALIDETDIPIIGHETSSIKTDYYQGVPAMSLHFENKKYVLPYRTEFDKQLTNVLIQEFHGIGVERHDDLIMSLWFIEANIRKIDWVNHRNRKPKSEVITV